MTHHIKAIKEVIQKLKNNTPTLNELDFSHKIGDEEIKILTDLIELERDFGGSKISGSIKQLLAMVQRNRKSDLNNNNAIVTNYSFLIKALSSLAMINGLIAVVAGWIMVNPWLIAGGTILLAGGFGFFASSNLFKTLNDIELELNLETELDIDRSFSIQNRCIEKTDSDKFCSIRNRLEALGKLTGYGSFLILNSRYLAKYNLLLGITRMKLGDYYNAEPCMERAADLASTDSERYNILCKLTYMHSRWQDACDCSCRKDIDKIINKLQTFDQLYLEGTIKKYQLMKPIIENLLANNYEKAAEIFNALDWSIFYSHPMIQALYYQCKSIVIFTDFNDFFDSTTKVMQARAALLDMSELINKFSLLGLVNNEVTSEQLNIFAQIEAPGTYEENLDKLILLALAQIQTAKHYIEEGRLGEVESLKQFVPT